jgi:hypothetical protein
MVVATVSPMPKVGGVPALTASSATDKTTAMTEPDLA